MDDDLIPTTEDNQRVDHYAPESEADQSAVNFSAQAQRDKFLGGTAGSPKDEQAKTPEVWNIIAGKGIEVISRRGWQEYRDQLERLNWEPFANTQIHQIKNLREKAKSEIPYDDSEAIQTRAKIRKYVEETRQKYPKDSSSPYVALSDKGSQLGKKLTIVGRETPDFGKEKATRVYMAIDEGGMRHGFEALREELSANGALGKMILALNLEVLDNEDPRRVDNNAIIMYVSDSNSDTLTKISNAIIRAKERQPVAFKLSSKQLADVNSESAAEFMVPLDDTSWFVEVEPQQGLQSYHSSIFAEMRSSVYRGYDTVIDGLPNISTYKETLESRRPEIRNTARIIDHNSGKPLPRRLAMPGLVVNEIQK